MIVLLILIEIVIHPIEIGTGSPIKLRLLQPLPLLHNQIPQYTLLGMIHLPLILRSIERIIIVAVIIHIIRVQLKDVLLKLFSEEGTASRFRIRLTGLLPIVEDVWVNEIVVDEILNLTVIEGAIGEVHHSISNQKPSQFHSFVRVLLIVLIQQFSQIRDVLPCVALPCNPERVVLELLEFLEEIKYGVEGVTGDDGIVEPEGWVQVV